MFVIVRFFCRYGGDFHEGEHAPGGDIFYNPPGRGREFKSERDQFLIFSVCLQIVNVKMCELDVENVKHTSSKRQRIICQ